MKFLLHLLFCTLIWSTLGLPASHGRAKNKVCAHNDEDCREKLMHPNMPTIRSESRQMDLREITSEYWLTNGQAFVEEKLRKVDQPLLGKATNVILFIGDGMSLATQAATRIYLGGQEQNLSFELFNDTGLAKTYAIDRLVPDSACTATAFLCGSKAKYGTIGVNGHVERGDCDPQVVEKNLVDSIAKWALDEGKSAGLVTTTRVTHATPAALYAHSSERDWENDKEVKNDCGKKSGIEDIASQLIEGEVGKRLKVVMGGGKTQFIDKEFYEGGKRRDGRNLIEEFLAEEGSVFIETKADLDQLNVAEVKRFMGLFNDDHLLYHLETELENEKQQPTLAEMTEKAIELLSADNDNGYFLLVEGGKIDKAHHETQAKLALDETAELSKAVALARLLTNEADTLIVVSADHSHTMSLAGYAPRNTDIFGSAILGDDDVPYMTLSYANGPSFDRFFDSKTHVRVNPLQNMLNSINDVFPATAPMSQETHGGEDVPVYASGPWSHLFSGTYEQSTIPHLMAFASCLGEGQKACDN